MTDEEWTGVCFLMVNAFAGDDFDEDRQAAYRQFLDHFDPMHIIAALHLIAENGKPFIPKVPEIVKACRSVVAPHRESWSEAWAGIQQACRHGGRDYHAGAGAKTARGARWLDDNNLPITARFFETEGYERMANGGYGDLDYGQLRINDVKERWEAFVEVQEARLVRGNALAALGRGDGTPKRLDPAAALGFKAPELGSGD